MPQISRPGSSEDPTPRAPDLLPRFEASAGRQHVLDAWKEEADTSTLRLEYGFAHVRYWRSEKKKRKKLHRELGPDLSPESLRELRLVREFAQDVDGILVFLQDILMPRRLEVHFDGGFQDVREALRRRIGVGDR